MTCKDCIHFGVCRFSFDVEEPIDIYAFHYSGENDLHNKADVSCSDFKDKSSFAELPCKVGDKVYFADASHYRCNAEDCYCCDNEGDIESKYDRHICEFATFAPSVVEMKMRNINDIFHWFSYFGKTIFLTREEAEAKLKEKKNDV